MRILGIETSCDDTAVCLIEASGSFGSDFTYRTLGNARLSQTETHAHYGGVFPNMARREHERNLTPALGEVLRQADQLLARAEKANDTETEQIRTILTREHELFIQLVEFLRNYDKPAIDCIAVTAGPGLEPALWVGINFAKALAHAWNVPLVPVNHMEGHIIVSTMEKGRLAQFELPFLTLLISGGHTELILSREWMSYEYLGRTRDDAVGEAFDKVARLLGLTYPGGPEISKYARMARDEHVRASFELPRPMLHSPDYDFSFAGLKTAARNLIETQKPPTEAFKKEMALEFEEAVAEVLVKKTMRAVQEHGARTLVVGGGVSANQYLRQRFAEAREEKGEPDAVLFPPPELSTDNAVMIALAGYFRALKNEYAEPDSIVANGSQRLT